MSREAMKQEPVAWTPQVWRQFRPDGTLEFQKIKRTPNGEWEYYSAPQRREWVGLTDEDMEALFLNEDGVRFARYIESRLKEKNA